ncbi:MAG: hypothetical protein ACI87H_003550 [Gammaproteobacteria bacterium]|jgi:hypothetical protein
MKTPSQLFIHALIKLIRPLIRMAIRYGIPYNAFNELVNRMYIEEAGNQLEQQGKKRSIAHISVLTGINKKISKRLMDLPGLEESGIDESFNRSVRVISGWLRDKDFRDKKGDPDALPFDGVEHSFSQLVKRYSGDMSAKVLAEELMRVDAIEYTRHGDLRLTSRGYVPGGGESDKVELLGQEVRDLIETIDHNITCDDEDRRFQRKVAYINFPSKHVAKFRELNTQLSQNMLEQLNSWLAEHDEKSDDDELSRIGVGIYQFEGQE